MVSSICAGLGCTVTALVLMGCSSIPLAMTAPIGPASAGNICGESGGVSGMASGMAASPVGSACACACACGSTSGSAAASAGTTEPVTGSASASDCSDSSTWSEGFLLWASFGLISPRASCTAAMAASIAVRNILLGCGTAFFSAANFFIHPAVSSLRRAAPLSLLVASKATAATHKTAEIPAITARRDAALACPAPSPRGSCMKHHRCSHRDKGNTEPQWSWSCGAVCWNAETAK
mmetsp:Transcript_36968/g.59563  ORF Transcript_36968/g.59563 Transcript_36968/m.59563 type:complete len:236 (-) Transcript_36968:52-759(-)